MAKFQITPLLLLLAKLCLACRCSTLFRPVTVECGNTALYYYFRKDPAFHLRHGPAVRHEHPHEECLVHARRRPTAVDEFPAHEVQLHGLHLGVDECQMGGWFRKEINSLEDLKSQVPRRRLRRPDPDEARRGAAADRGGDIYSRS